MSQQLKKKMGILTADGRPLSWEEIQPHIAQFKERGVLQFVNLYNSHKERKDGLKWGDEMEYCIVKFDKENRKVRTSLRASEILQITSENEQTNYQLGIDQPHSFRCETNTFMLESSPGTAFETVIDRVCSLEENLKIRRKYIRGLLAQEETLLTATFPSLGCKDYFTAPPSMKDTTSTIANTSVHECAMTPHPRYKSIEENIRERRGRKIAINLPVYKDKKTKVPFTNASDFPSPEGALPDHIYGDSFGLAFGCCGLQITVQGSSMDEARLLHDQLTVIAPLVLALTAATPILGGCLTEQDTRWQILSMGIDDRTSLETTEGLESRWCNTMLYIDEHSEKYNDVKCKIDTSSYSTLTQNGVDHSMAMHVARQFVRDPIVIYSNQLDGDDPKEPFQIYDYINSTNYNIVRLKGPPTMNSPDMGWRVELRTMEIQLTEFENAAYTCFVMLLSRIFVSRQFDFRVRISKMEENMERAQKRDAVNEERFHFSVNSFGSESQNLPSELSMNEIVNGCHSFVGLLSLIENYLDECHLSYEERSVIDRYLEFISKRASGEIWTQAKWIRNFVAQHPEYKQDSCVNEAVIYDLWKKMNDIANEDLYCVNLLGQKFPKEDTLPELDFSISFNKNLELFVPKERVRRFSESLEKETWDAISKGDNSMRA